MLDMDSQNPTTVDRLRARGSLVKTSTSMLTLMLLLMVLGGGCQSLNQSISPGAQPLALFEGNPTSSIQGTTASLSGHDRSNWPMIRVQVPVDTLQSYPIHTGSWPHPSGSARQDGLYPTAATALEMDATTSEHWAQAFMDLMGGIGAVLIRPLRTIQTPPRTVVTNPQANESFQRLPTRSAVSEDLHRWHRALDVSD